MGQSRFTYFFAPFALFFWPLLIHGLPLLRGFGDVSLPGGVLTLGPLILKQTISGHGPSLPVLVCPCTGAWSGCWQDAVPVRPKCLPRSLTRWQGPHPPHSRLLPWLLSTQRDIFSFYLLFWMMVTPLRARAKPPLGLSCCCRTLRSVGNLPSRMCCGHSRRYHTVWVTSHLLGTRQSQVSRHVPRLCQGTRAKSILAAITRQSQGEWQGYSCPNL